MSGKRVVLRQLAERDIDAAVAEYLAEKPAYVARFLDRLERALDRISRFPAAGSPRYALESGIPGLRVLPLRQLPFLIFYVTREQRVEVWRVLYGHRDIAAWLLEDDEP